MRSIPGKFQLAFALLATPCAAGEAPDWAVAVFPSGSEFALEIAADPETRRVGYMYREQVGPTEGMLFLFESTARHGIWMKNCKVALDIIWLDEQWRVVDIVEELPPCRDGEACIGVEPLAAARYVLEVAGGAAGAGGLKRGDRLVILADVELP